MVYFNWTYFVFTARPSKTSQQITPAEEDRSSTVADPNPLLLTPLGIKPPETSKPEEQYLEKPCPPTFIPPKIIPHSPKISPSSIPNPNPSVTTTKQVEPGYPNYGGYMYSVPGYSAFQPVSYSGIIQPSSTTTTPAPNTENNNTDFSPFPIVSTKDTPATKENEKIKLSENKTAENNSRDNLPKTETDFEEQFMPEIIPAVPLSEANKIQTTESKMSVTSLAQGSGAIVTIPSQVGNKDVKKKPERFSLKTSIPISKIDLKCVSNPPDTSFQNNLPKKHFNPAFHTPLKECGSKIEIQSNIVIKSATKEPDIKDSRTVTPPNNSISTLINAAEVINKTENQFKMPEPLSEISNDNKESQFLSPPTNTCSLFNPINLDTNKSNFQTKPPDSSFSEPKNQIVFIQNKSPSNAKMLLAIQQQNPQVLLQRTNFDSKNLQAPSRPSSQSKKCKEELVSENGASSKVVSLKRMHQDNYDENDFENLITENQIYGNKIVVKEKSQGTLQEQDLKLKSKVEKSNQSETKNVVLQPNFVYLSNVQFPANLMMIKNNSKANSETNKIRVATNENKQNESMPAPSNDLKIATSKSQNISVGKEIHVLKSNNNVLQTLAGKNGKSDLVFQTPNQKVLMNPQIVYQVPMIVDTDNKLNQTFVKGEYPKIVGQNKKEIQKTFDQTKTNDKLYIACPYQMDSKLQPKIVITNIRPKLSKPEEISALDIYEQKKRLRRLKYLSNRDPKINQNNDTQKTEGKKSQDNLKNIITPEKMKAEIYKEFTNTKCNTDEDSNESGSDYGEDELEKYKSIIDEYGEIPIENETKENDYKQAEFLSHFRLASRDEFKERELDRQERVISRDAVASAYIAVGRIDCLLKEENVPEQSKECNTISRKMCLGTLEKEQGVDQQRKRNFLTNLNLIKASRQYKEDYEKVWQEILKERKRRDGTVESGQILKQPRLQYKIVELDPKDQLQILTEIKKHVNENNNLIKKRLDSFFEDGDSIKVLAEKNFSELNRLSKMADRSVKHFSGQDTQKRDLNPGFDSENIQKATKPGKYYPNINIPNISKIISLKTTQSVSAVTSTQATSMDEPQNSAAGNNETLVDNAEKVKDFSCQVDESCSWTGIEAIIKTYKEYELARKREVADLHKRNTSLRVESAHITRAASRDSDRARALLAERRNLANEERTVRNAIQWLYTVVDIVRNYEEKK
nr:uncharacterized protein LOC113399528 [Vanessa tameamea]